MKKNKSKKKIKNRHLAQNISFLIYTFFITVISTLITYYLLNSHFKEQTRLLFANQEKKNIDQESPTELESQNAYLTPHMQNIAGVILNGSRQKKQVALTFDADMTPGMKKMLINNNVKTYYDESVIETLRKTNTKATLFLSGMWIELYPETTAELAKDPLFELGNHSYSHGSFSGSCYGLRQMDPTQIIEEIGVTQKLLSDYTGKRNILFRFPGGCYNEKAVQLVHEAGANVIQWDVAGVDGFNKNVNIIIHNVVDKIQNGSIIVLHMNGPANEPKTAEALPQIIEIIKNKGFKFVKVSELLHS